MKKMKKILAFVMAMAMVLGMGVTAFADSAPTTMPHAVVTVENVAINMVPKAGGEEGEKEDAVTVTAYQIVKYDLSGKYIAVKGGTPSNMEAPTADEMWTLAKDIAANESSYTKETLTKNAAAADATTTSYTKDLNAGMWLILIKGAGETIYNPMVASVVVGTGPNGEAVGGSVDANGNFEPNIGSVLYAKSSTPDLEKTTTDPTFEINDDIHFVVKAQIPDYGKNYETVKFNITDQLSGGLVYNQDSVVISIRENKTATTGTKVEVTPTFGPNSDSMAIEIPSATVIANTTKYVVVEYTAKLSDDTKANLNKAVTETKNEVKVEYSNNPLNTDEKAEKKTETKQYTFGLNALLNASDVTKNFVKVGKDEVAEGSTQTYSPLTGAVFELVKKDASGAYVTIANIAQDTTNSDGLARFVGLEGNVDYYLHEVSAPAGYSVESDRYVKVRITPTIEKGELKSYIITVGESTDELGGEHAMTYTWNDATKESTEPEVKNPYNFVNTKLANLPSTGGIGTTIFTIGGCAIMIVAAGLFFASRRKSSK